ncbi:MAG: hypothetical protein FWD13_02195 [Treponema sp.]|nr:hypothetical protein [Treponema sp.]
MAKFARLWRCHSWHKLAILSFFSFFLLFAVIPAFGGGGKDADLVRADELIKNREHEEAILVLTDYARRNPNRFDQAQQRLRTIYRIRDEFNRTADELIATLINDPGNDPKILALSQHLYTLEHEDSPLLINFVARTREIAQFNVNRNLLRSILERGRKYLDDGDSAAAIQTYAEGMSFMRLEFFAAGYDEEIENEVRRQTGVVNLMLADFQQADSLLETISSELVHAINTEETAKINEVIERLRPAMDNFIVLKHELYEAAGVFEQILNEIRKNDTETVDRNHLAFLSVLIHGRSNETIQEGMLGAFDNRWVNSVGSVVSAFASYIGTSFSASLEMFNNEEYSTAVSSLNRLENYITMTPLFFLKHQQLFKDTDENYRPLDLTSRARQRKITFNENTVLNKDIREYMEILAVSEASALVKQVVNITNNQNIDRSSLSRWQDGSISTSQALNSEQQVRNHIISLHNSIDEVVTQADKINTEIQIYHNAAHLTNTVNTIQNLRSLLLNEENLSAQRYYTIAHNSLYNNLLERRIQLERSRNLINGRTGSDEDAAIIYFYPTEALQELNALLAALTGDLQSGNSILNEYRNEQPIIITHAAISNTRTRHQATVDELNQIQAQGLTLAETARFRSSQAEAFRNEGLRLFNEAQTAYQRQAFDVARERLHRADERFNDSLELQDSPALRQMRDTQLIALGQAIDSAENETIIAQVRNLLNSARNSYYAGDFQQAENSLVFARNRWSVTNTDENEEIVYWLGIVRTALSASSGRIIPPTAPLYAEMSQLLSQAQRNYEDGVRFVNTGQRAQGIVKFNEARQLTREVRLMFPLNQQAGILELRIEQFLDPAAFNASFEERLRAAQAGTRVRSLEAYADLQNLAEINPRYPNMRAILTQAQYDMGFLPPPPNPADVARSRELTASANRIIENNQSAQFDVALRQLNEAISLNPDNTDATRLRDRLLPRMNIPSTIVLTNEDENIYQRALRELEAGNNLTALALVERLMQNPRNRNITKLVELQRRIRTTVL